MPPSFLCSVLTLSGPQYHEDQALAIFGCFDGKRKGMIAYQSFIDKITNGFQITQKKFAAMLSWGERERQWQNLEQKHADKFRTAPEEASPARRAPRRAPQPPPSFGAQGGDSVEREKVRQVYQAFASCEGLTDGKLPSIQEVNGWLQEQDIGASKADARRILSTLDPCERDGTMMSFGEFWDWWQMAYGMGEAEPMQQKRVEHYDMGKQPMGRGVGAGAWKRRDSFGDTRNPHNFGGTRALDFVGTIKNRDSSYVPYFHRLQAAQGEARNKISAMPQAVVQAEVQPQRQPQKENYQLGRQSQNSKPGRGHFVSSVGVPNSTGINFSAHRGGFRL